MDARTEVEVAGGQACDILSPARQSAPVVLASPHSSADYPSDFVVASRLDLAALRRSEDSYVDELFGGAAEVGAPLLRARFPRAYVDANREPYELDPAMFTDDLPSYANTKSARVSAGLGTIARVVTSGDEIYRDKLSFSEARRRIEWFYKPYHRALSHLVSETRRAFGCCLLIDCHSMPSLSSPPERSPGRGPLDVVLGDCYGVSCAESVVETAEEFLESRGYAVQRNIPYAGGFTTRHYGRPSAGVHVMQIEINRALYMNESTFERAGDFTRLCEHMSQLVLFLGRAAGALAGR